MPRRWAEYLGGFVTVKINGDAPERIINQATSRGIFLWDLRRQEQGMEVKVRLSGYKSLTHLIDPEFGLEVVDKKGLPFWRRRLANRLMLVAGALIFIFMLYFLSSLVWRVEISGNRTVNASQIKSCAARAGLYPGAFKWNFSKDKVAGELLKKFSALSFVEVKVRGVTTTITVVEKILPPVEVNGPCHIVAAKAGVISEILPLEGQAAVKPGDAVVAGDILISGVIFPEPDYNGEQKAPYTVHARGRVKARVWYEGYGEWPLETATWQKNRPESHRLILQKGQQQKVIVSWGKRHHKQQEIVKKTWRIPGSDGRILTLETRFNKVKRTQEFSPDEALNKAKEIAIQQLQEILKTQEKVLGTRWQMVSTPTEDIIRMKAIVEVEEEISSQQPIVINGQSPQ
ncbi:MAG: sporulation protein YqfD [Methylocystaceae bacterium]